MNAKTILVPIDFSDATTRVTEAAISLAAAFDGALILLHVEEPEPDFVGFEPGPQTIRVSVAHELRASHQRLDEMKAQIAASGRKVTALHIQGPTVAKILHEARTHGADLIVIGSHGHGALYHLLVGGVTSGILKDAPCPVLVVPARSPVPA